jgi:hypothetical protein
MTTFDQILPQVADVLRRYADRLPSIGPMIVNRDLNGRVRLVVNESAHENGIAKEGLDSIAKSLCEKIAPHAFSPEDTVLFEEDIEVLRHGVPCFSLAGFESIHVVDRLAVETDWANIAPESKGVTRIVFFSIKGGVGRSTALAASAWALAETGKRVLVLDLDLESPGLSSALLPEERRPVYGIADWLVEDLVDNGDAILPDLIATSTISHDGEIYIVPAHGKDPGEYVAKLGRVWMAKTGNDGSREPWSRRLSRLIDALEVRINPDVILIDSRAGIDEVAASCITDLGAALILLFAVDGDQTWSGYKILLQYWNRAGKAVEIRERLQVVGAMIPDDEGRAEYFGRLREQAWKLISDELYDEVPAGESTAELFSFDETDESAPHYPCPIRWSRGFAAIRSLHGRLAEIDPQEVKNIFGPLIEGLEIAIQRQKHE